MKTIYIIYEQHGNWRRAAVNSVSYEKMAADPSITQLSIYPTQSIMEQSYNNMKGINSDNKRILLG